MLHDTVGVIGGGSFGTTMANLLAANRKVILYDHNPDNIARLRETRAFKGRSLDANIDLTSEIGRIPHECNVIFPVVPSAYFRNMLRAMAPHLTPAHLMIHATKGLHVDLPEGKKLEDISRLHRDQVFTMSELIRKETSIVRVGCVAGPNLAAEIAENQPAATVVASHFDEVIREGQSALRSSMFRVHGNHDLFGIELAGVLKNIMAIASGILSGMGYGENSRALLITRGLAEMATIGKHLGADPRAFLGLAGLGDLVATCQSPLSRNYTVGLRLAKGEKLDEITQAMDEVAEGIKTVKIVRALTNQYKIPAPITLALNRTLFEDMEVERGMRLLMEFPFREDVEFI